jgi:hypothetical protein
MLNNENRKKSNLKKFSKVKKNSNQRMKIKSDRKKKTYGGLYCKKIKLKKYLK